jgi:hypothetical protein
LNARAALASLLRRAADQVHPETAAPGAWWARPAIGSRRRAFGREYVLVSVSLGDGMTLQYATRGSWDAAYIIDPHVDCRPRRRLPWKRRPRRRPPESGTGVGPDVREQSGFHEH